MLILIGIFNCSDDDDMDDDEEEEKTPAKKVSNYVQFRNHFTMYNFVLTEGIINISIGCLFMLLE